MQLWFGYRVAPRRLGAQVVDLIIERQLDLELWTQSMD